MSISGATRVAGVVGRPIAHSMSPILHNAWLAAAGCALAAAVFLIQAALGRPVRRARWLNAVFGVIFAVTAIWLVSLRN